MVCLLGQLRDTGCASSPYLCICEDIGRDNLVRPKRLSRVDKGCKNLSRLATFAWRAQLLATSPDREPRINIVGCM